MCIDSALLYSIHAYILIYISKTLLFILITIYTHVSFSAQPSKFHYVIGGHLHNEIQSAHILETSMSAKEVACGINVHVTFLCRLEMVSCFKSQSFTWLFGISINGLQKVWVETPSLIILGFIFTRTLN